MKFCLATVTRKWVTIIKFIKFETKQLQILMFKLWKRLRPSASAFSTAKNVPRALSYTYSQIDRMSEFKTNK